MTEEETILAKLVVDEKDVTRNLEKLVEEATKYFKIERQSGKIIFQNYGILTDKQRVATVLIGKYFAYRLKLIKDPSLSISEIAKELGRPMTALSGPAKELVVKGYIENLPGRKYRVAFHRMKEIFEDILMQKGRE
jgi:predicted Rossmann fold nucleotide-binding protein DprA/Smf involved in DNA uptake